MKNKIFSKIFLDKLEQKAKEIDLLNFIMGRFNLSFHDAILMIADHLKMDPEYFDVEAWEAEFVQRGHPNKHGIAEFIKKGCGNCEAQDAIPPGKVSNETMPSE